jgi:hypothetical protein
MSLTIEALGCEEVNYWIACGSSVKEAHKLDTHVKKETPEVLLRSTENYWRAWKKIGDIHSHQFATYNF